VYRIGDFATLSQIPVKTLRYYDDLGLLRPARVDRSTGYRYYAAAQLEQLNRILAFKDLGFSLREIRALLAERVPAEQIRGILRRKREEVERRVVDERARLARVVARLDEIERHHRPVAYEVAVRRVGARLVASMRDVVSSYDEYERLFAELEGRLRTDVGREQRAVVWHHGAGPGLIDCEALVFLTQGVAPVDGLRVYEVPAHTAACLVYRGEDADGLAFAALADWLAAGGVTVTGSKREVYLDEARDREPVTEIQYPIAARFEERAAPVEERIDE